MALGKPATARATELRIQDVDWLDADLPSLEAAGSNDEFELHLAALEWSLDPTILIHSAEDIKARKHWQEMLKPFEHQVQNLITFCRRAPVALIADDVGLGKTISAGLILSELRARGAVNRCLVLAPKLLGPQWAEELRTKFGIGGTDAVGGELMDAARGDTDVVITTYDSARSRMSGLADQGFDMLILDEVHHLRNLYGTKKDAPKKATAVRDALASRSFKYVLMLTATPIQNRLWDLYSLIDMLTVAKGHENPLGDKRAFVDRYIADTSAEARRLKPGRQDEFRRHLSQYMVRTRREDCGLLFPDRRVQLVRAQPSLEEEQLFDLVAGMIDGLNPLVQTSVAQALMSSPQALLSQLRNMSDRLEASVRVADVRSVEDVVSDLALTGKEEGLLGLLRDLRKNRPKAWRVVIFTSRKETQKRLQQVIESKFGAGICGYIAGGRAAANQRTIADYWADPPRCNVVISTDAGAEGVNLQKGNIVVNYDLPWNPMLVEQRIGRVQRLGSEHANVSVLNLVLAGSVEEKVVGRLQEKLTVISATIGDIEGVLENAGATGADSSSFEGVIRDLVVKSLKGRDVDEAVRRQLASIERAKQIYEEEKKEVEEHLGRMDAMHSDGPPMPQLSAVEPRLSEPDFTLGGLRAAGFDLRERDAQSYELVRSGFAPELICFDADAAREAGRARGIAGGRKVSLYRSGQPAFERLVSEWTRQSHAYVRDLRNLTEARAQEVVHAWLRGQGMHVEVGSVVLGKPSEGFHGKLVVRGAANVAHDKYEKLVHVPVTTPQVPRPPAEVIERAPLMRSRLEPGGHAGGVEEMVHTGLVHDADFEAFCGFYMRRRAEEEKRAKGQRILVERARQDFTPTMSARLVGARGVVYGTVPVEVQLSVSGGSPEPVPFILHSWGEVMMGPKAGACAVTGVAVPDVLLASCAVTGKRACKHLLVQSDASKKFALPSEVGECEETGLPLLKTELAKSAVSGKSVDKRLLVKSQVSNKKALESELATCEVTGKRCFEDELAVSEVSGLRYVAVESFVGGDPERTGHKAEFVQCTETNRWFPPDQMGRSDVTDRPVAAAELVASEKAPGRKGAKSDIRPCAISGLQLLRDEVGECAVTGDTVDLELLEKSTLSGALALPASMTNCEVTGYRVLPTEVLECSLTGKVACRDLLRRSDVTGQQVLKTELVKSSCSNRYAEPAHMRACEVSGDPILEDEVSICELTQQSVRPDLVAKSDVSGRHVLASMLVQSAESSSRGLPDEMVACAWDGQLRVPSDTGRCRLTGLIVGKQHLCADRSLAPLLDLADHPGKGHPFTAADLGGRDSPILRKLHKLKDPSALATPDARGVLIVGERPGFLGFGRHTAFFFVVGEELLAEGRFPG